MPLLQATTATRRKTRDSPTHGTRVATSIKLVALVALAAAAQALPPFRVLGTGPAFGTMMLGFLLLAAYLAGQICRQIGLPQITGYLILGIVVGPHLIGLLPDSTVVEFRLVNEIALSLIALSAGGELRLSTIRKRARSIGLITGAQFVIIFAVVGSAVYLGRGMLGFLEGEPERMAFALALLFGLVAVAKSPATTIAVMAEERAHGVLTDTVLGVTIIKDVLILILMAILIPLSLTIADPRRPLDLHAVQEVSVAIMLSLAVGAVMGWAIVRYLRHVGAQRVLFILAVAFVAVELAHWFSLESILVSMTAGFIVQNYSDHGPELIEGLEANSLPIYSLFFAVAGADLDINVLPQVWQIAAIIVVTRILTLVGSTYLGTRMAGDDPVIGRYAWTGFLSMAGVTLGIANRIRIGLPGLGDDVAAIIIGVLAVNQLIGPPLFRLALVRSGESQRAAPLHPRPVTGQA